ncbi:maleylpyruvate isomerase family mycothiol-dependent enzyme [Yinghuangia soli]|uniref:Maleylpyruvate isomerase family mycothiol-dependent enzyme n=1 Tax=Yinghuangia soli TaxID=2908204 RepID=A0AA41U386_9ACTN|nr:maleylpyruvate isomerase family mycothiol-dependent enzyme [Yinghuangia soli]MCF2527834.1 maleylpyruvate isomerase family mycothiol-dependent enzyme [Yinghuangia soli]
MDTTPEFSDLLRLIDERSAAFRAAVAAAPSLDAQVPTCPDWTLSDLIRHIGEGRHAWAATVAAGPKATAKSTAAGAPPAPGDPESIQAWLAASTHALLDALREAGPDRGCWMWWGDSQSPPTCHAVARHQLQELAVHTYDAQLTAGAPQSLPAEVALDGVEDFLSTCCSTSSPWPHKATAFDFHAAEGRSWRLTADATGARYTRNPTADDPAPGVSVHGSAGDLVLFMYDRIPLTSLRVDGDSGLIDLLRAWDPDQ